MRHSSAVVLLLTCLVAGFATEVKADGNMSSEQRIILTSLTLTSPGVEQMAFQEPAPPTAEAVAPPTAVEKPAPLPKDKPTVAPAKDASAPPIAEAVAPAPLAEMSSGPIACGPMTCEPVACCEAPVCCKKRRLRGIFKDVEVGGWVEAGVMLNTHGDKVSNGNIGFNDDPHLNMNQLAAFISKEADGSCGLDWGFQFDYMFGTDGQLTQAFGDETWDFGWNSSPLYGSAIPQLYGELALGKLSVKAGRFYTIIGYEVVPATGNFFYSHAWTMYYAEPFTHTGFLAEYALNDCITLKGGWVDGWDSGWENTNGSSMFLGGIDVVLNEKMNLFWAFSSGDQKDAAGNAEDTYMQSLVFTWQVTDKLEYILQNDIYNGKTTPSNAYGVNQYLLYTINPCWKAGTRIEWFRDVNGQREIGTLGTPVELTSLTMGLNWTPNDRLTVRPEVRWDKCIGENIFNDGENDEQVMFGCDVIVTF